MEMINLILTVALAWADLPTVSNKTVDLLRAKDQALLNAIAPGNRKIWDQALAADAVFVDENGGLIERAEFLKQLAPLPSGVSGSIKIVSYSARITGDLASVIHTDEEDENYFGQALHARYLTTETWHLHRGEWKLHLVHTFAVPVDPPAVSLPAQDMRQYEGTYTAGASLTYVIQWDGRQLLGCRKGGAQKKLQVELRDVLFVPGQPRTRKIFRRDEEGKIQGFADRREGSDLVWRMESLPVHRD